MHIHVHTYIHRQDTHLTASFPGQPDGDDGLLAVVSAGPYANHLHLTPHR